MIDMSTNHTLLIVDDNSAERERLTGSVDWTEVGIGRVLVAADGAEAIKIATSERPDIVLLDLLMPVIDGFKVLNELALRGIATRVVIYTGEYEDISTAVNCVKHGACDFITKSHTDIKYIQDVVKRSLAMDATLNLRILHTSPSVKKLIADAEYLSAKVTAMSAEIEEIRSLSHLKLILTRILLLAVAITFGLLLRRSGIFLADMMLLAFVSVLFVLLIIPWRRLRSIEARFDNINGRLELNSERE